MRTGQLFILLMFVVALLSLGCSRPTAEDRNNRRLVEQVLTAITLKNDRLLEEGAQHAAERHDAGHLSDADYREVAACIEKARDQDWGAAETEAYAFRKKRPFVKPGQ